nr:MAG TPA: hypothetical protein [Caudoviricetes sp.]
MDAIFIGVIMGTVLGSISTIGYILIKKLIELEVKDRLP